MCLFKWGLKSEWPLWVLTSGMISSWFVISDRCSTQPINQLLELIFLHKNWTKKTDLAKKFTFFFFAMIEGCWPRKCLNQVNSEFLFMEWPYFWIYLCLTMGNWIDRYVWSERDLRPWTTSICNSAAVTSGTVPFFDATRLQQRRPSHPADPRRRPRYRSGRPANNR